MLTPDCRRLNPDPRPLTLEKKVPKQTCKPSSVLQPFDRSNGHSSRAPVTRRFKRPTRERRADHPTYAPLFGLAPSGVYQALDVATETGELLPHRFTLTSARGGTSATRGGLFSVALSFPSPGLGVTQHSVLRSSDFPPIRLAAERATISSALATHALHRPPLSAVRSPNGVCSNVSLG